MEILRSFTIGTEVVRGEDDLTREFIISTERKDSHGTIIPLDLWDIEDYNRAGAFYYQHQTGSSWMNDANPDNALGIGRAKREGSNLIGIGTFEPGDLNPLAEKIMRKVDYGTMKATSVGFMALGGHWGEERDGEDPTAYYFDGQVLKEWSIVHIPSNPDAVKKALEPMEAFMMKQIESHRSEGFRKDYRRETSLRLKLKSMDLLINKNR